MPTETSGIPSAAATSAPTTGRRSPTMSLLDAPPAPLRQPSSAATRWRSSGKGIVLRSSEPPLTEGSAASPPHGSTSRECTPWRKAPILPLLPRTTKRRMIIRTASNESTICIIIITKRVISEVKGLRITGQQVLFESRSRVGRLRGLLGEGLF
ncbi:UNVERIFIED_CONTAM: hypothetical protein Sradi_5850500 [Sesamum radiatum]|uniref:Uncharacterized protein n=1 Tax=Sesamum radiatum TaxID=300843 RepID=A0AAW2KT91_SESRA